MNRFIKSNKTAAFTIVELLVVIVVIGILASISLISYSGITTRARVVSIKSDLANSARQLKLYNVDYGYYPVTVSTNCTTNPTNSSNLCIKASSGNDYATVPYIRPTAQSFILSSTNGPLSYYITDGSGPTEGPYVDPTFIMIGSQLWYKQNANTGTMITGATEQTDNAIVEKHCYNNLEANCTTYGALYEWNEAMQYNFVAGTQGVCPAGSHIPTDEELRTLEVYLGMTPAESILAPAWRGTDQGLKIRSGGTSGFNFLFAGARYEISGIFGVISTNGYLWTSTESAGRAYFRYIDNAHNTIYRNTDVKGYGYSVRCLVI